MRTTTTTTLRSTTTTTLIRAALGAATAVALALALAGCGGDTERPGSMMGGSAADASSTADHDRADVMFSMMMIPHHEQAIEMADLVPTRSTDLEVLELATQIRDAQQPEVDTMTGWLEEWGASPMGDMGEHSGHGGMGGMMSEDEMGELADLEGPAFDERWLTMMVDHHEGAIDMAQDVLKTGSHDGTRTLAEAIITSQQAEITQMQEMLAG